MQWVDVGGRRRFTILLKMESKIDCILVCFCMILFDFGIQVGARLFVIWFLVLYGHGLLSAHLFLVFDKLLLLLIIDYNLL